MAEKNIADTTFSYFNIEFDAGAEPVFKGGDHITGNLRVKF